ncbi:hypothetical protein [Bradyrhizobium sp. USDA 4353]
MPDVAEIQRFKQPAGLDGQVPDVRWEFRIDLGDQPDLVWGRIIEVVGEIISFDSDSWAADDDWRLRLPDWLISSMLTLDACKALMLITPREEWGSLPWEFGSWLDRMRERQWKWWGYERAGRDVRLILQVTDIPPGIDGFKQILLAAGARILFDGSPD